MNNNCLKFKKGTIVKIRKDLEVGMVYGGYEFTTTMEHLKGEEVTVVSVVDCETHPFYTIDGDSMNGWSEEMFEKN